MDKPLFVKPISPLTPDEIRKIYEKYCYKSPFFNLVEENFYGDSKAISLIKRAYEWNYGLFIKKRRRSGGFTMTHHLVPVAVIIMEVYGVRDPDVIAACLTHDTVEDIPHVTIKMVSAALNSRVAYFVEGLTEPLKLEFDTSPEGVRAHQVAKFNKVASFGLEAILIKTAGDRLHNILTLDGSKEEREFKITETLEFVIPMAQKNKIPVEELQLAIKEQLKNQ